MFSATVSMDSGVRVAALQLALLLWGATTTATVAVAMERPKMGSAVDNGWPKADLGAHIPPRRILLDTSVHGGYAGGDREHMRWTNAIAVLRWHGGRNANKPPAPTFSRTLLQQDAPPPGSQGNLEADTVNTPASQDSADDSDVLGMGPSGQPPADHPDAPPPVASPPTGVTDAFTDSPLTDPEPLEPVSPPAPASEPLASNPDVPAADPPTAIEHDALSSQHKADQEEKRSGTPVASNSDGLEDATDRSSTEGTVRTVEDSQRDSAEAPGGHEADQQEDDGDSNHKNFGFEFDRGTIIYIMVIAGMAVCMCPFAAWQCCSKQKKAPSDQFLKGDVQGIQMNALK